VSIGLRHTLTNAGTLASEYCEILGLSAIFGALAQCGINLTDESGNQLTDESGNALVRED
jgi:hypothetical protein